MASTQTVPRAVTGVPLHQQHGQAQPHQNQTDGDSNKEDLISSPPGLWLPTTVVRKNRKVAITIWSLLLGVFIAYVTYIIYDGIKARANPAASMEVEEKPFTFPDIALCLWEDQGCYGDAYDCAELASLAVASQSGFVDEADDVVADEASLAIEAEYPSCRVLPISKMTIDQAAVDEGEAVALSATFVAVWSENPYDVANDSVLFSQLASIYFVNVDDGLEAFGDATPDAYLPYSRMTPAFGEVFTLDISHMMITLTEFTGISSTGQKKETQQTYIQRSTGGNSHWAYDGESSDYEFAVLMFSMTIAKFEYMNIEEVDPVDGWTIIGAIGGVWQLMVIAFGLFFVFQEKQLPEYKIRNFKKSIAKPAVAVRRLSLASSSHGNSTSQDEVIDASDEDLPAEWVKKRRPDGSTYYHNAMTGVKLHISPHELGAHPTAGASGPAYQDPSACVSQGAYGTSDGRDSNGDTLPPGWIARKDSNGRPYYMNTVKKETQWKRPSVSCASASGHGVRMVDAPVPHTRQPPSNATASTTSGGNSASAARSAGNPVEHTAILPAFSAVVGNASSASGTERAVANPLWPRASRNAENVGGGASGDKGSPPPPPRASAAGDGPSLPANWEKRHTSKGKVFYANHVTKRTQWTLPTN